MLCGAGDLGLDLAPVADPGAPAQRIAFGTDLGNARIDRLVTDSDILCFLAQHALQCVPQNLRKNGLDPGLVELSRLHLRQQSSLRLLEGGEQRCRARHRDAQDMRSQ